MSERTAYQDPLITRVKLEDRAVVAQTACKDSLDTSACAAHVTPETVTCMPTILGQDPLTGQPIPGKDVCITNPASISGFDLSPS